MQDQMTVFISHSFNDQPEFENVTDWLDRLDVPYWKPAEIKSGASLHSAPSVWLVGGSPGLPHSYRG